MQTIRNILVFVILLCTINAIGFAQNAKLWGIPLSYSYDQFKSSVSDKFGNIKDNGSTFRMRADFAGFSSCPIEVVEAKNGYILFVKIIVEKATRNDFTSLVVSYMDKYVANKKISDDEYMIQDNKLRIYIKYLYYGIDIKYVLDNNSTKINTNDF